MIILNQQSADFIHFNCMLIKIVKCRFLSNEKRPLLNEPFDTNIVTPSIRQKSLYSNVQPFQ